MAAEQLAGVGRILPLRADSSREAAVGGATQLIHGYYDRRKGATHFEFSIEDAVTHTMRAVSLDGDALRAADTIAKAVEPPAKPFSTSSAQAVQLWGEGNFERAVELDPDFGLAWRDLIQSQAARPEQALQSANKALARSTLRSPLERVQIQRLAGQFSGDAAMSSRAVQELVRLVPNDSGLVRKLAEEATNLRQFPEAIQLYRSVLRLEPEDSTTYNLLGYAQFFSGDLPGARQSLDEYSRHPGQEANGQDSQGEILFMAGQFGEAEKYFLRGHEANPGMLEGADLLKAAYARWLSGDLAGADAIFERYLKYRSEHADPSVVWRRSTWEYSTGRQAQAVDRLKGVTGPSALLAQAQLKVFESRGTVVDSLSQDLARLEQAYKKTPPSGDGLVRVLFARGLLKAGKKAETAKLVALWPLPESGDPSLQPLLYPMFLELKESLAK